MLSRRHACSGHATDQDRSEMSVLKRHRVPGMPKEAYDEVANSVADSLASARFGP